MKNVADSLYFKIFWILKIYFGNPENISSRIGFERVYRLEYMEKNEKHGEVD